MLIIVHVGVALSSIGYAAYAFFRPTVQKIHITYALIAGTFLTGFTLVFAQPEALPQVCTSGLLYIALMLGAVTVIHRALKRG